MEVNFKYDIGQVVTDKYSNVTGIIDQLTITITGNIQYSVQPKSENNSDKKDSWWFDEDSLMCDEIKNKLIYFKYETGKKAKDKITGFKGIIVRNIYYANGCVQYLLRGKYIEKNNEIPEVYVNELTLKTLNSKIEISRNNNGGQSTKSKSFF